MSKIGKNLDTSEGKTKCLSVIPDKCRFFSKEINYLSVVSTFGNTQKLNETFSREEGNGKNFMIIQLTQNDDDLQVFDQIMSKLSYYFKLDNLS